MLWSVLATTAAAFEFTRPAVVRLRRRLGDPVGKHQRALSAVLPRPHWLVSLGYWILAASMLAASLVFADPMAMATCIAATAAVGGYSLFCYHNGAEFTGQWSCRWLREFGPLTTTTILYDAYDDALQAPSDRQLTLTWRSTVARFEPSRLFTSDRRTYDAIAGRSLHRRKPVVWYGNARLSLFACHGRAPIIPGQSVAVFLGSNLAFAIPVLRETLLALGYVRGISDPLSQSRHVFVSIHAMETVPSTLAGNLTFVPIAESRGVITVGKPHEGPWDIQRLQEHFDDTYLPTLSLQL